MRLSSYIPAVLTLLVAGLLAIAAANLSARMIERSAYSQVTSLFAKAGEDWTSVQVDGLRVTLSGIAPDEATRFKVLRLAGQTVDASRVIDEMQVAAAAAIEPPRFSIEILRNDAGVSLIGLVPAAMDRDAMARTIADLTDGANVADLLETADHPIPFGWAQALSYALDALGQLPRTKISVSAEKVEIKAISDSASEKRLLETKLKRAAPDAVRVALDISAPRPVITPFTLRFLIDDDGARFDACSAHTEQGRAEILASAALAGLQGKATCILGLGVPSPDWPDAVTKGIAALSELGGGSITFSDADVSLVAMASVDESLFDRVAGGLESSLPDVFSLSAVRPEPVVIDGTGETEDGPPEFIATKSPEGLLQLRGKIANDRQRAAVEGFARANFAGADVQSSMRVDEELPDGWARRVFAGLEAMAVLSNGSLVVQPDFIDLRGNTGNQEGQAEISRSLSAALGDAEHYALKVNYVEALDPTVVIPTPEECIEQINTILSVQKITFEPGSDDIAAEGFKTIDLIADVLRQCEDVPMEIAGHTDSQGREVMNQALSQRRAEAVLTALQGRRVLTGSLTPTGYGEAIPIGDNDTEEGREANRRIEFTLIISGDGDGEDETPEASAEEESEEADGQN